MKNFEKAKVDYSVYLCTDRDLMSTSTLEEAVEKAILGGATLIQLREKACSAKEFYETAVSIKKITERYNVPLIINDRVDIALAVDAEGVHIGQSDLPAKEARRLLGEDKIVGVTASTKELAVKAFQDGADYLGVGAMFATSTKKDAKVTKREELLKIRESVSIPIIVIGGVNETNVMEFKHTGINGIAVVSAIIAKPDIERAARQLKDLVEKIK
ncbi:thiamine phosphate synthase [[Clostridium] polysaccharolyticum]|uniref:Thiamine-phosphate synthase n=1 Tax=[Clostridium] polysaccharolyticum TaxID=29364 RepID=A0A1H9YN52_9FIRM|nr:thiamine phosphate synthase [[Clostridium] polysaccharolyticum]SES70487.1 thiamine-phosphate pyrophosphorylase [[Clostridium] polysaccharolyticum]